MLLSPPPHREKKRLQALNEYEILDTPAETAFDDVIAEAAQRFNVPIALFSLIDERRQWFKSKVGIGIEEADRADSFCGHVIATNSPLIIEDTSKDIAFSDNPFVVGYPKIGFYAGVPVRAKEDSPLGTVCIIDHVPRKFPWGEFQSLRELGRIVESRLEARRAEQARS